MKRLLILALLAALEIPGATRIVDTLYLANGTKANAIIRYSNPAFTTAGGVPVAASTDEQYLVKNGAIDITLQPNIGSSPGPTSYSLVYTLSNGTRFAETWVVPDTPGVVKTLRDVRTSSSSPFLMGSALTLPWSVAFVNPAGALAQDQTPGGQFCWDPVTHRLGIGTCTPKSKLQVVGLSTYADNAAALAGGLTAGAFYTDGAGALKVVF